MLIPTTMAGRGPFYPLSGAPSILEGKRPVNILRFIKVPSRQSRHLKTWAGLGKVPQRLAPTCASRLTRMRPVADPRPYTSHGPRVEGVMQHEATSLLKYGTLVPRPSFGPALVGFAGSATVLVGVMLLLSSVAQ
jgi:hypothetical protein